MEKFYISINVTFVENEPCFASPSLQGDILLLEEKNNSCSFPEFPKSSILVSTPIVSHTFTLLESESRILLESESLSLNVLTKSTSHIESQDLIKKKQSDMTHPLQMYSRRKALTIQLGRFNNSDLVLILKLLR